MMSTAAMIAKFDSLQLCLTSMEWNEMYYQCGIQPINRSNYDLTCVCTGVDDITAAGFSIVF